MSLTLLQGYSSDEQEGDLTTSPASSSSSSLVDDGVEREEDHEGEGDNGEETLRERSKRGKVKKRSLDEALNPPANSFLPSALDAFNEITGPPEFLNNCAAAPEETREALGVLDRKARSRSGRDRKDLPAGAVVEAKAQLVGIRERVRNDIEGSFPSSTPGTVPANKRIMSATNPDPKDAAELLRVCLQCGVPKTYSHTRGMVCPLCGDRAPAEHTNESDKKKGSVVKDKEKMKRMKGQSSHATWKSETEMQLRQQYD